MEQHYQENRQSPEAIDIKSMTVFVRSNYWGIGQESSQLEAQAGAWKRFALGQSVIGIDLAVAINSETICRSFCEIRLILLSRCNDPW